MKIYKVIDIKEQDYGCEERPDDEKYCVDVLLQNEETNEKITISVPDEELYEKMIDVDSSVSYNGQDIRLIK